MDTFCRRRRNNARQCRAVIKFFPQVEDNSALWADMCRVDPQKRAIFRPNWPDFDDFGPFRAVVVRLCRKLIHSEPELA